MSTKKPAYIIAIEIINRIIKELEEGDINLINYGRRMGQIAASLEIITGMNIAKKDCQSVINSLREIKDNCNFELEDKEKLIPENIFSRIS